MKAGLYPAVGHHRLNNNIRDNDSNVIQKKNKIKSRTAIHTTLTQSTFNNDAVIPSLDVKYTNLTTDIETTRFNMIH